MFVHDLGVVCVGVVCVSIKCTYVVLTVVNHIRTIFFSLKKKKVVCYTTYNNAQVP